MPETANPMRHDDERRVLLDLLDHVGRHGDPRLPWDALPALGAAFAGREAVLEALAARWSRMLRSHLDPVLDLPDDEREEAANRVTAALAAREPALHAVLIHHGDYPVLARARERDADGAGVPRAAVHGEHVPPRYRVVAGVAVTTPLPAPTVLARAVAATARLGAPCAWLRGVRESRQHHRELARVA